MIILAIFATLAAVLWSLFVMLANGMSSNPSAPFQGGVSITLAWLGAIVLWAAWAWG